MFSIETFIEDCRSAVAKDPTHKAISDIMGRAMDDKAGVMKDLGEPTEGGVFPLYRGPDVTIINVIWPSGMIIQPHNHDMWANIGVYTGREDNIFWRRLKDDPEGRIEAAGAKTIGEGEFKPLGADIIHSVINPLGRFTGALHVYGGDFFDAHQSEWDKEDLHEYPRDMDAVRASFAMD